MTRHFGWLLVAFSLAMIPLTGAASDWPNWRGPKLTGVSMRL